MEAQLLFILVGIAAYITGRLTQNRPGRFQFIVMVLCTTTVSAVLFPFGVTAVPDIFILPLWLSLFSGCLAGLMLALAYRIHFFTQSGFRYSATILLSMIHAVVIISIILGVNRVFTPDWLLNQSWTAVGLPVLLISFLQFFGFALLERMAPIGKK